MPKITSRPTLTKQQVQAIVNQQRANLNNLKVTIT